MAEQEPNKTDRMIITMHIYRRFVYKISLHARDFQETLSVPVGDNSPFCTMHGSQIRRASAIAMLRGPDQLIKILIGKPLKGHYQFEYINTHLDQLPNGFTMNKSQGLAGFHASCMSQRLMRVLRPYLTSQGDGIYGMISAPRGMCNLEIHLSFFWQLPPIPTQGIFINTFPTRL
jgi:hypothetical protein